MNIYGLIGKTLKHSWSGTYFSEKFAGEHISASYKLFELAEAGELPALVRDEPNLCGLNVTIPFKQSVIPYLSDLSPDAAEIGAVNTIRIRRSGDKIRMTGFNTDAPAFGAELAAFAGASPGNALVLGSGGAAMAVAFALKNAGWNFSIVSREGSFPGSLRYRELSPRIVEAVRLIVNATPLGMFPATDSVPLLPWEYINSRHLLFDLVYNPEETLFLKNGLRRGARTLNGLGMLKRQAELAWQIWQSATDQEK